ncbi:MAG: 4-alpha-glucanotransferase [Bacillota bacterium]|nr:4-alpha-glucanotransferase [Bacillota bacterium]
MRSDMERSSGILLHISSLPSPYGVGTLGREAREFIEFLDSAGQRFWQMLPVGPTGFGDSPYQSFSSFAGNPFFVDLGLLAEEGLLTEAEAGAGTWGDRPEQADYSLLARRRPAVLRQAYERGRERLRGEWEGFCRDNDAWLKDYALFMALKEHFRQTPWDQWEDRALRFHRQEAADLWRERLAGEVEYHSFVQYLFFRQWGALKAFAEEHGIRLIGDLPIYAAPDSADVWGNQEEYLLDGEGRPLAVGGTPPDAFTSQGQLWGNPLYRWEKMKENDYRWWKARMGAAAALFHVVRLDHFRGLESYWQIPAGAESAAAGCWAKGPGLSLIRALQEALPDLAVIAEDLGCLTPEVRELLEASGWPGMKVLEFAFDSLQPSDYLPHRYGRRCAVYTGTHDNLPAAAWFSELSADTVLYAAEYLGLSREEGRVWGLIRGGMSSVGELFIAQMQDYLELGRESRMNTPGTLGGNWQWRLVPGQLSPELARRIRELTALYER